MLNALIVDFASNSTFFDHFPCEVLYRLEHKEVEQTRSLVFFPD